MEAFSSLLLPHGLSWDISGHLLFSTGIYSIGFLGSQVYRPGQLAVGTLWDFSASITASLRLSLSLQIYLDSYRQLFPFGSVSLKNPDKYNHEKKNYPWEAYFLFQETENNQNQHLLYVAR